MIFQGRCVQLPRVDLRVKEAEFIDLDSDQEYTHWYPAWSRPPVESTALVKRSEGRVFYESEGLDPADQPSFRYPWNVGLTRVGLYWDFLGGTGLSGAGGAGEGLLWRTSGRTPSRRGSKRGRG